MDAIDRKILALLQQDASHSVAEIGSLVGLSSTPCWKRIQRLEADGVIQRRVALVDQDKLGLGVTVFVSIETGDHSQQWLDRFAAEVGAMPAVMEFYRMAGGAAQKRHLAIRHGEDQGDNGVADSLRALRLLRNASLVPLPANPKKAGNAGVFPGCCFILGGRIEHYFSV